MPAAAARISRKVPKRSKKPTNRSPNSSATNTALPLLRRKRTAPPTPSTSKSFEPPGGKRKRTNRRIFRCRTAEATSRRSPHHNPKGSALFELLHHPRHFTQPLIDAA